MRFWLLIGVFAITFTVKGQDTDLLANYLHTSSAQNQIKAQEKIDLLIIKLGAKAKKSDRQFLKNVFNVTHRQVLKEYQQYTGFGELFNSGKYDCLTATALYSLILSRLGYQHTIIETNYHIFLMVQSDEGRVLMESTDPLGGFEYDPDKIENRIHDYKLGPVEAINAKETYSFETKIFQKVSPFQLTGLLYYNQSILAFNNQQWDVASQMLAAAKQFYNSPRIREVENLLLNIVVSRELEKFTPSGPVIGSYQIAHRNP